jgi:hypothetical protein
VAETRSAERTTTDSKRIPSFMARNSNLERDTRERADAACDWLPPGVLTEAGVINEASLDASSVP